jgi:gluconate 5-dehydrogenase/3-oxoacyl-[acyl-carrier protein] reductase
MPVLVRKLAESTALLCGGSAGIGLATARALAASGVPRVMLVGRTQQRGEEAISAMRREHPACDVRFQPADVTTVAGAESAVNAALGLFGAVDVLVNTAGARGAMPELFARTPIGSVTDVLHGLVDGVLLPSRAALPAMMEQGGGTIINVASDAGKLATPGESVIGAGMAAIMMFSRALANEAKRSGVRVNCLTPSIVRGTPLYDELMAHPFASKIFAKAEKMASLGVVDADELAQLAVFLSSPEAAKITGQCVSMNGGISSA